MTRLSEFRQIPAVPSTDNPALTGFLRATKQILEVYQGNKGNRDLDRVVRFKDITSLLAGTTDTDTDTHTGSNITQLTGAQIKALYEAQLNTNCFTDAFLSKLGGIESGADKTDYANVEAAGAMMEKGLDVITKTDDYTLAVADFGKSLRMNSANDKMFTFCSMEEANDGARISFVKQGAGKLTISAVDSDCIYDSSAGGTIYSTTDYATLTLEYVHAITRLVIIFALGMWKTT